MPNKQDEQKIHEKTQGRPGFLPSLIRHETMLDDGENIELPTSLPTRGNELQITDHYGNARRDAIPTSTTPADPTSNLTASLPGGRRNYLSPAPKDVNDDKDSSTLRGTVVNKDDLKDKSAENQYAVLQKGRDEMASIIASELNQLGQEGRKLAYMEVHGVDNEKDPQTGDGYHSDEPATNIDAECVATLLANIKRVRERTALDKAMFLAPKYVRNPEFCQMFLRAEGFDSNLAARRLAMHFKHKMELFGLDMLARDITWKDLSPEDQKALMTGSEQYLGRDRSGRTILFSSHQHRNYKTVENQMRAIWYLAMRRLKENDSMQQRGVVVLRYNLLGITATANRSNMINMTKTDQDYIDFTEKSCLILAALPLRIKSFHFCYDNIHFLPSLTTTQKLIGRDLRVRFRAHNGSFEECLQALRTYGIPKEVLPINSDGSMSTRLFHLYLEGCKRDELSVSLTANATTTTKADGSAISILPNASSDVLLGRGRPYQEFPGNVRLAELIDQNIPVYASASKSVKGEIIDGIVLEVTAGWGGRFLKKCARGDKKGEWILAQPDEAREKVSHVFRVRQRRHTED